MKTRAELLRWSKETDFRPEALEKVYLLQAILHRLEDNELSQGQWVLKGGTAINLFHWAVPRLSVDIDINFIGVEDVERLGCSPRFLDQLRQSGRSLHDTWGGRSGDPALSTIFGAES